SEADVIASYKHDFNECRIRFGDMKKQLAEDMVKFIAPIRQKTNDILANENYLKTVMEQGAEKARKSAKATMDQVRMVMGLNYF
ncbi:MAG TPA: tryptophan--tRNA ligase, partial [Ferruginibacter sp.]|nr:tryptophan--tRNA ligase [Ferruginibacter sp.]